MTDFKHGDYVIFGKPGVPGWGQGGIYRVVGPPSLSSDGKPTYCVDHVSGPLTQPQRRTWVYASELTPA